MKACAAIVSVAERGDGFGFGVATNCASPDPLPDAGDTVSQSGLLLDANQAQDADVTTPTDPVPPAAGVVPVDDCRANVHACPACDTETDCPAIATVVDRGGTPGFGAMASVTEPLPDDEPGANPAHVAPLVTVHAQLLPLVMTPMAPLPPAGPNGAPSADVSSVTLQAAAFCEIVNDCPPITIDPLRGSVAELALTVK